MSSGVRFTVAVLVAAGLATIFSATAGSLEPPPGPVLPTGRFGLGIEINSVNTPASTDARYSITKPGRYYLASDILLSQNPFAGPQSGIEIAAHNVTIEMNGFSLKGTSGMVHGITVSASRYNLVIRNGTIEEFGGDGIRASASSTLRLEDLFLHENLGSGIWVSGSAIVERCLAFANEDYGIYGSLGVVRGCTVAYNGVRGIQMFDGLVAHNSCTYNGIDTISNGFGTSVDNNCN
jgi:hypothetical protein